MTENVIKSIVQTYPEIAEKYLDFLSSLNISFDEKSPKSDLDFENAEKFIVSVKLQRHIQKLNQEKQKILSDALNNQNSGAENLKEIDEKIKQAQEKLELLLDMNNK